MLIGDVHRPPAVGGLKKIFRRRRIGGDVGQELPVGRDGREDSRDLVRW